MQKEHNAKFPPSSAAPQGLVQDSHSAAAAAAAAPFPAANAGSRSQAPPPRAAPHPAHLLPAQPHVAPPPPQQQPFAYTQYGQQTSRRSAAPAPAPYYAPTFGNLNHYAPPNYLPAPTPNYPLPNQYPFPYRNAPAPTSAAPPPPIQSRDFPPTTLSAPRFPVAPVQRKSKAIPIVNPETNEEVKISKATVVVKPSQPTQVTPPIRKPLDVVNPAHISSTATQTKPTVVETPLESTAAPAAASSHSAVMNTTTTTTATETAPTVVAAAVVDNTDKDASMSPVTPLVTGAKLPPSSSSSSPPPAVTPATVDTEKQAVVSDVTENKDADKELISIPSTNSESSKLTADTRDVDDVKPCADTPVASPTVDTPEADHAPIVDQQEIVSVAEPKDDSSKPPPPPPPPSFESLPEPDTADESDDSPPPPPPSPPLEDSYPSPPKRERPPTPDLVKGRRAYNIPYLRKMREFADQIAADEYDRELKTHNISKSQRGSRQDGSGRRGGRGSLSGDPRGHGVLGPRGGYAGARNAGVFGGPGSHEFDLGGARNQRPPPDSRGGDSGRGGRYDPRGSRSQDDGFRRDGPMRGGVGPLDGAIPGEKLKKSENHWARKKEDDTELEAKVKTVRSHLNKLTIEKFDRISDKIIAIDLANPDEAQAIVAEIFEKTLFEPKFAFMYAKLCKKLDSATTAMFMKHLDAKGKPMTFRKVLLKLCQIEFSKASAVNTDAPADKTTEQSAESGSTEAEGNKGSESADMSPEEQAKAAKLAKEEEELKAAKAKRRMLANITFIGQLYLKELIYESVIHKNCIQHLLIMAINQKEEETLEALCKLISAVGQKLSGTNNGVKLVPEYFRRITQLSQDFSLPPRSRFMLQDLIDQRNNGWKLRREEEQAKAISDIHKDIAKEEREKAALQASHRNSRRDRGLDRGRDRRGNSYGGPPMQMTMGGPRTSQNTSRANAALERFKGAGRGGLSGMRDVRLGPGGGRSSIGTGANGWKSVGGTGSRPSPLTGPASGSSNTSLRPASSRSGFAALMNMEPREGGHVSSSDARRSGKSGTLGSSSKSASPPQPKGPEPKSDDEVRRKARSIMQEYWEIKDVKELSECIREDIGTANAMKFVEFCIRETLAARSDKRKEGPGYFKVLVSEGLVGVEALRKAFAVAIADLENTAIDDPLAPQLIAGFLAAVYSTGKLGEGRKSGLEFLAPVLRKLFGKVPIKFVLAFLSEYERELSSVGDSEDARRAKVRNAMSAINLDLVDRMLSFNLMKGISNLEDMLKDAKLLYVVPSLEIEKVLMSCIQAEKSGEHMLAEIHKVNTDRQFLSSGQFASQVCLRAFTVYFSETTGKIGEKLSNGPGKLVKLCHRDSSPPADVQMAVLVAMQPFLMNAEKDEFAPPLAREYEGKKHGYVAFDALYDADVVEEETFMKWKGDDSTQVMEVGGKAEVLLQTASWFNWLETAEPADETS